METKERLTEQIRLDIASAIDDSRLLDCHETLVFSKNYILGQESKSSLIVGRYKNLCKAPRMAVSREIIIQEPSTHPSRASSTQPAYAEARPLSPWRIQHLADMR